MKSFLHSVLLPAIPQQLVRVSYLLRKQPSSITEFDSFTWGGVLTSWGGDLFGPVKVHGDNFTKLGAYDFSNQAADIAIAGVVISTNSSTVSNPFSQIILVMSSDTCHVDFC